VAGRWFSPGTPVSSTNKTGRHDITEILLKVALNTIIENKCLSVYRLNRSHLSSSLQFILTGCYNVVMETQISYGTNQKHWFSYGMTYDVHVMSGE
jgi:hypothetical protein